MEPKVFRTFSTSWLFLVFLLLSFSPLCTLSAPSPSDLEGRQAPLPPIPNPPADPKKPANDGAGPYNSQSPTRSDKLRYYEYRAMVKAADTLGLDNAARNLDHYLDNVGSDFPNAPDNIMADIPAFKETVRASAEKFAKRAFTESKVALAKRTFVSPWTTFYATKDLSSDWFFALGGFSYSVAGSVWVRKVQGKWTTELKWRVYIFDRYNWDTGKGVTIGPFSFTDKELGRMHLVGLAKEYVVRGKSSVFSLKAYNGGKLPAPGLHPKDDEFNG